MTEPERKALAADIAEGRVFGSWMVPNEHLDKLPNLFLPLAVGAAASLPEDVWGLYEYRDRALPLSCEGLPVFVSCKYLRREDGVRVAAHLTAYRRLVSEFFVAGGPPADPVE